MFAQHTKPSRRGATDCSEVICLSTSSDHFTEEVRDHESGGHHSSHFLHRIGNWKIFLTICVVLTVLIPTVTSSATAPSPDKVTEYRVVVDAGSSGTRANIYAFTSKEDLRPFEIKGKQVTGGLNNKVAFVLKPGQWDHKQLVDLTEAIFQSIYEELARFNEGNWSWRFGSFRLLQFVKKVYRGCWRKQCERGTNACQHKRLTTPVPVTVQFLATEGMRTYNRDNRAGDDALMRVIRSLFKKYCEQYRYEYLGAEILHGELEATGAWVDANCRYPNANGTSIGIIEMGGASLQMMSTTGKKECWDYYGKNAAMRKIVEEMTHERARETRDEELAAALLDKLAEPLLDMDQDSAYLDAAAKDCIINALAAGRKKVETDILNIEAIEAHDIFKEGHETELENAIRKYLFTEKDIKKLRAVTAKRTKFKVIGDGGVISDPESEPNPEMIVNSTWPKCGSSDSEDLEPKLPQLLRQMTTHPENIDSAMCEQIKESIKEHPLRNYLLVCSFEHLQRALVEGNGMEPDDNFFEFVTKTNRPKLPSDKWEAGNRFVFYFSKVLYEVLQDRCPRHSLGDFRGQQCGYGHCLSRIDTANTKIGEVSWSRGMAIISAFDKEHDTELPTDQLRTLINTMRKNGFARNTLSGL